jgi:hypothetical protein
VSSPRHLHKCGACGARLFTARLRDNGRVVHVEKVASNTAPGMSLLLVPELPIVDGMSLPHVVPTRTRQTFYREHVCTAVRSFTGRAAPRKVRT